MIRYRTQQQITTDAITTYNDIGPLTPADITHLRTLKSDAQRRWWMNSIYGRTASRYAWLQYLHLAQDRT